MRVPLTGASAIPGEFVPTISQLVRKGREKLDKKVKAPAFRVLKTSPKPGHPDLPTRYRNIKGNPQAFARKSRRSRRRSRIPRCVRSRACG